MNASGTSCVWTPPPKPMCETESAIREDRKIKITPKFIKDIAKMIGKDVKNRGSCWILRGSFFGDPKNGHVYINSLGLKKVSKNLLFPLRDRMLKSMVLSANMLEDGRAVMTFIDNVDNNAMTADSYGNHIKTAFHGLGCSQDHIFC